MTDFDDGDPPRRGLLHGGIALIVAGWVLGATSLVMDWELFGLGGALALFVAGLAATRAGARRVGLSPSRLALIAGIAICAFVAPIVLLLVALDFTRVW